VVVFALGIVFILLGLVGLVLPFLQGILFLVVGLVLLSISSPVFARWAEQHTQKFPKVHAFVKQTEQRVARFIDRI
jgi:uncharacterized membrane protein YbaN (DUF454 family)